MWGFFEGELFLYVFGIGDLVELLEFFALLRFNKSFDFFTCNGGDILFSIPKKFTLLI